MSEESGTPSFREQQWLVWTQRDSAQPQPAPENVEGTAPEEVDFGTPQPADDVLDSQASESYDGEEETEEELESQEETLEADSDEPEHDYEKRYKDLQAEYTRVMQSREEFESEMTDNLMATKRMQFELEDTLGTAARDAQLLSQALTGNAERFRGIDWSQVPADQVGALQRQQGRHLPRRPKPSRRWRRLRISGRSSGNSESRERLRLPAPAASHNSQLEQ